MNEGCVMKQMKLTSPEGHLFSQRQTAGKIKKLGYSYNCYQSLVKDAPVHQTGGVPYSSDMAQFWCN